MVKLGLVAAAAFVLCGGCKKKEPEIGAGSGSAPSVAGSGVASGGSAGSAAVVTAAGDTVGALPVVADCPKSLGGTEKVARTIKKACGPIPVTSEYTIEGSLTLEAGVVLQFAADAQLTVGYNGTPAKLIVQGGDAPDQRVVFTSGGDKAAGVWKGVHLYDGADRSQITGLDVEYAGAADGAAVSLAAAIDVAFTKCTIKHARNVGLETKDDATFSQFTGNTFDDIAKVAMIVDPVAVGTLGAGNTFPKDAFIEIRAGKVPVDATWHNAGTPYHVVDDITVDSTSTPTTLTLADVTLAFASGANLSIGYSSKGKLIVTGPATFTGLDGKPGSWKGVHVYSAGEANIDNATFTNGGVDDSAALNARSGAKVTLGAVTFTANTLGLMIEDGAMLSAPKVLTFNGNDKAARVSAAAFGGLGATNVYADGQAIEITGGRLAADSTWSTQAKAVVSIVDTVTIEDNHTLTVAAGGKYAWKSGTELAIGYASTGTLKVNGTPAAPVAFTSLTKDDQWNGVKLYGEARGCAIASLDLSDVAGDAGVVAKGGAVGKLDHVTCARCAATFAPECAAKIDQTAVTTGAATKIGFKKPDGC